MTEALQLAAPGQVLALPDSLVPDLISTFDRCDLYEDSCTLIGAKSKSGVFLRTPFQGDFSRWPGSWEGLGRFGFLDASELSAAQTFTLTHPNDGEIVTVLGLDQRLEDCWSLFGKIKDWDGNGREDRVIGLLRTGSLELAVFYDDGRPMDPVIDFWRQNSNTRLLFELP